MKKRINKIIISILVFSLIFSQNIIFASMADYTNEQADNKQKQEQQEWKKEQEERIGKSSNNYLKSLSVIGYEITPTFDKQTVNYEINSNITDESVEVIAETDDEKSSVSGTGKLDLNLGENNLRIDVTAENGTVRTYFIKVMRTSNNTLEKKEVEEKETEETEVYENRINQIQSEDAQKNLEENKNVIYVIIGVVVLFILSILVLKGKRNGIYKRKH